MLDLIKRFGHVIAAIVIAWYAYSALDSGVKGLKDSEKPLRIPQSSLPLRAEDETVAVKGDPFFRDWAPYGPEYSPEAIARRKRAAQETEEAAIRAKREARIKMREGAAKKKAKADRDSGASSFQPFVLELESVLMLASGGVARISGRTVRVGDKITGMDKAAPPVLTDVQGGSVEIRYRGTSIRLDITERPSHRVTAMPDAKKAPAKKAPAKKAAVADTRTTADAGEGA